MEVEIYHPQYPLNLYIKSIVCYTGYSAYSTYEAILPELNEQLIIELDGNTRYYNHQDRNPHHFATVQNSWIVGLQSKPTIYESEKDATIISVQFQNGGLKALLGIPSDEFSHQVIDADLILPQELPQLRIKIIAQKRLIDKIKVLKEFFETKIKKEPNHLLLSHYIARSMCFQNLNLAQTIHQVGYSQKHTIKIFKSHYGVSPKQYQKRFRFNKAIQLLHHSTQVNYADIALQCHYYDQAHFINDFKSFAFKSPKEYFNLEKTYHHVMPLNSLR